MITSGLGSASKGIAKDPFSYHLIRWFTELVDRGIPQVLTDMLRVWNNTGHLEGTIGYFYPPRLFNPQRSTGSPVTQQVHDLCTEWLCLCFLCFTLQGPVFCPWDRREMSTLAKSCVPWHFCPLANTQS